MWCVAVCHDAENALPARGSQFQAHAAHNIANLGAFLFTAPLATADGVVAVDSDPRLDGSIYCVDTPDLAALRKLMEADPYFGGAWRRIDYYEWRDPKGQWLDEGTRPKGLSADFRCYLATSEGAMTVERALMNGPVALLGSTGEAARPLQTMALLRADTLDAAKAQASGATRVAAVPVAIGRWVRISKAEDLPRRG